ncbi:hypothetical protein KP509_29G041300 [Ceratopteris richardii]|uniref:Uncharacterized protein n=1 Tax=Ceratopteris richardii TaxID=49495 RepID=A0A8T2R6E3_CERRI|nr:hypothetical protein KP509_29G041300 [Ceratopteris richardii]
MAYSRSIFNDRMIHTCLSPTPLLLGRGRADEEDFSFLTGIGKDTGESPPISPKLGWGAKQSPTRSGVEMRNNKDANLCSDCRIPCERTDDPYTADCLNRYDEPQLPSAERFFSASGRRVQKYRIFSRCFSVDTVHEEAHRLVSPSATMETNIHKSNRIVSETEHRHEYSVSRSTPYYTVSNQNSHSAIADHCSRRRNPGISNFSDVLNMTSYDHDKKSENQNIATISASRFHSSSNKSKNSLAGYYTQRRKDFDYSARRTFLPYRTSIVAVS